MKDFKAFFSNDGFSYIEGELLEVRIESYHFQENGSCDIIVSHRGQQYLTKADNFYLTVEDYEKNIKPNTSTYTLACYVNFENLKEQTTWVIKDNQPVRIVVNPAELVVFVDKKGDFRIKEEQVPSQTFPSYERAMLYCDLIVKKEDGTEIVKESLAKLIKPTEEQMKLLKQLQELEKKISKSGLEPLINFGGRYFINTEKLEDYCISDENEEGMSRLLSCDLTKVPFGYGDAFWGDEFSFYAKRKD